MPGKTNQPASAPPLQMVRRKYLAAAQTGGTGDLAVRVEHEGQHAFYPLFAHDVEAARPMAAAIQQAVVQHGWAAAGAKFVREFTLAIFWLPNPLTCTYTSLLTTVRAASPAPKVTGQRARVAVMEPEAEVRQGLAGWLDTIPGYRCTAACANESSLIEHVEREAPDLVLFDAPACIPRSTELQARLAAEFPAQVAFPFGIYSDSDHAWMCVTGVDGGYFYRRRRPEQMLDPIAGVWQSHTPTRDTVEAQVRHHMQTLLGFGGVAPDAFPGLTQRERDVLLGLRRGHTDKSLATLLGVSVWTVHTHMKSIFEKLGVHTRAEAVAKCFEK